MPINKTILIKSVILAALVVTFLYGYSFSPPTGHTGCFSDSSTCIECHSDHSIDTGDGSLTIDSQPLDSGSTLFDEGYVLEHPYTMMVTIEQIGQIRWGFEMIARFEANGEQAGHFEIGDDRYTTLQVITSRGWEYIGHSEQGTRYPTPDGPVSFIFKWTAPKFEDIPPDNPKIVFCAVGNAANGDFTPGGDWIYSASRNILPNPDWFPAGTDAGPIADNNKVRMQSHTLE